MWYKVEDKLPKMTCSDYGWQESEKLLVKTVSGAAHVACCWSVSLNKGGRH